MLPLDNTEQEGDKDGRGFGVALSLRNQGVVMLRIIWRRKDVEREVLRRTVFAFLRAKAREAKAAGNREPE